MGRMPGTSMCLLYMTGNIDCGVKQASNETNKTIILSFFVELFTESGLKKIHREVHSLPSNVSKGTVEDSDVEQNKERIQNNSAIIKYIYIYIRRVSNSRPLAY